MSRFRTIAVLAAVGIFASTAVAGVASANSDHDGQADNGRAVDEQESCELSGLRPPLATHSPDNCGRKKVVAPPSMSWRGLRLIRL
jgi:hypothetical protein